MKTTFLAVLAFFLLSLATHAAISEPGNVLYGSITLDNAPVTAARTDVIIQARRTLNGSPLATYRMGSNSRIGDFYNLDIPLESLAPITNTNAAQSGETFVIVLLDATGLRGQINYTIAERAHVQRVDFGVALLDSDADTFPDAWELLHFGNLNSGPSTPAPNGLTLLDNFIIGSAPNDTNAHFKLNVAAASNQTIVTFYARRAEGPGYENLARHYTIESAPALAQSQTNWTPIPNFTQILANNQTIQYQSPQTNTLHFYRAHIHLTQP